MRLGFAVKVLGAGGLPSHDTRRWRSDPHLRVSLGHLGAILAYLAEQDIRMYRMTASLAPYATHPDHERFHGQVAECEGELDLQAEILDAMGLGPEAVIVLHVGGAAGGLAAGAGWSGASPSRSCAHTPTSSTRSPSRPSRRARSRDSTST
ncbi:MAG: damage endonuclease [Solirubrobacteraceae bacterium]|jgi:UV DNA damage endonuclease|nr:damage endonuclease [Solirubrobacteraceae bacterium]